MFIIILALFDTTILPLPTRDTTKHSDFYTTIAKADGDFLVFDYPAYTYQEYMFFQTIHEKRMLSGYGIYLSPERVEWYLVLNEHPWDAEDLPIRYVIFHKGYANPSPSGTIDVNGYRIPPEGYFDGIGGIKLVHDDKYIKAYKVMNWGP